MYHHLNTLTVFADRLVHNLEHLYHSSGITCVPVIKSNAYGHGIKMLTSFLQTLEIPFICVDSLYEAFELEKQGYKKDILIMGYVDPRDIPQRTNFIYAVSDMEYGLALVRQRSKVRIHIFLDTGMRREGIVLTQSVLDRSFLAKFWSRIEWVMSHLLCPEDIVTSNKQIELFRICLDSLREQSITPRYIHILASGGLLRHTEYADGFWAHEIARTGLAFYGYWHPDLLPALRCTSRLIQMKTLKKWDTVGYDATYIAPDTRRIWVLPIGYHDGMDRRLSNVWKVMIGERECSIIGRVSMNLTTIDISDIPDCAVGQEVVIFDENPASPVSLEKQATRANMIPYDMLVHINKEMYRTVSK